MIFYPFDVKKRPVKGVTRPDRHFGQPNVINGLFISLMIGTSFLEFYQGVNLLKCCRRHQKQGLHVKYKDCDQTVVYKKKNLNFN